jgi:hypothetical protein
MGAFTCKKWERLPAKNGSVCLQKMGAFACKKWERLPAKFKIKFIGARHVGGRIGGRRPGGRTD